MSGHDDLNALGLVARPGPVRPRSPYRVSHHRRRRRRPAGGGRRGRGPRRVRRRQRRLRGRPCRLETPLHPRTQTGQAESDRDQFHAGSGAAKITHTGQADWSFETNAQLPVVPGDLIELNAWVKIDGPGGVTLAASTWGADRKVVS